MGFNLQFSTFLSLNPSDAEVDQLKKEIDEDDSGDIDFDEFLELMNSTTLRYSNSHKCATPYFFVSIIKQRLTAVITVLLTHLFTLA